MIELGTNLLLPLGQAQGQNGGSGLLPFPLIIVALVVLFYLMVMRPERQRRREHQAQLEALKKNDRVVTIGGIYGVVTNVQRESDEVTLKIDEATNTKIRVTLGSVARVVSGEEPAGESTGSK